MPNSQINIDYSALAIALSDYVRKKAASVNSKITYFRNGQIVEENPKSNEIKVLKTVSRSSK